GPDWPGNAALLAAESGCLQLSIRSLFGVQSSGSLRQTVEKLSVCRQFTMFWKKNSLKTETMKNFPETSIRSGTTSITLKILNRSTEDQSTGVSMIMFLTPHPE